MQLTGFAGKLAIVTGAGGGIGAALVDSLVASGATVIATDRELPEGDSRKLQLGQSQRDQSQRDQSQRDQSQRDQHSFDQHSGQGQVYWIPLDVTDSASVNQLVQDVESRYGPIEFGINVAGVLATGLVAETSDEAWKHVFSVNTDGVFYLSRALAQVMTPRKRGAIVTVSSNAAGIPRHSMAAYAASKAASMMFTRSLGLELAPHGIRCNVVAPGSTLTPMQTGMWADSSGAQRVIDGFPEFYKTGIPLQKLATAQDVANAVMFLLSDQAGHIALADLYVDGGATLRG